MCKLEYDPAYDPVEHLDRLKVRIVKHTLSRENAIWSPERRMIVLGRNLAPELVRPTLTHECDHVLHDDCGGHHVRNEARANLHSAIRLINPVEWKKLTRAHSDYDRICLELGITRRQFRAYHENELRTAAKRARLERYGNALYLEPKMGAGQWAMKLEVA